jgi:hypothetical protein
LFKFCSNFVKIDLGLDPDRIQPDAETDPDSANSVNTDPNHWLLLWPCFKNSKICRDTVLLIEWKGGEREGGEAVAEAT